MGKCKEKAKQFPFAEGALLTEYQKEYIEKEARHIKSTKALLPGKEYVESQGPLAGTSTFKNDYKEWPLNGDRNGRKPDVPLPHRPMNDTSTYNQHYPPKAPILNDTSNNINIVRGQLVSGDGGFEDYTTHKQDYQNWGTGPVATLHAHERPMPNQKFEHETLYKTEYQKKSVQPAPRRATPPTLADVPLDGTTTYNKDFPGLVPDAYKKKGPKCRERKPLKWEGGLPQTEYQRKYDEKGYTYPGLVKPAHSNLPDIPLNGAATYKSDYKAWEASARKSTRRDAGVLGPRPFDDSTTYKNHFTGKAGVKDDGPVTNINVLKTQLVDGNGAFYGETTNKNDFQKWKVKPPGKVGPGTSTMPQQVFDHTTTYHGDFIPHATQGKIERKPQEYLPSVGFANTTSYAVDYVPHPLQPPRKVCHERPWTTCDSCVDGSSVAEG